MSYEYVKNNKGHEWIMTDYGSGSEPDIFAYSSGFHNGPKCKNCGYEMCYHCHSVPDVACPKAKKVQAPLKYVKMWAYSNMGILWGIASTRKGAIAELEKITGCSLEECKEFCEVRKVTVIEGWLKDGQNVSA